MHDSFLSCYHLIIEELPIIKEKVKEAGNGKHKDKYGMNIYVFIIFLAAKRKMLDFYNQLKASRNNNNFGSNNSVGSSSIPATNAHYKFVFVKIKEKINKCALLEVYQVMMETIFWLEIYLRFIYRIMMFTQKLVIC